jgi:serine/threonine-protein phosphatase 2A regulatory subunit B''
MPSQPLRANQARLDCRDEMDLVAFTDFVLAWDHRALPPAIKYFFPIMDLRKVVRNL